MAVPGGPFGSSYGPILALATGMFVFYGLLSLPQGWLAQRLGHKILMTAFFLGVAAALIGAGLAHSPTMLAIALAFAGGFAAISTRSERQCWWRPLATNRANPSA